MNDLERITEIKNKLSELTITKSRLEGRFDAIKKTMQEEYGTTDIKKLIKEKQETEDKIVELEAKFKNLLQEAEKEIANIENT